MFCGEGEAKSRRENDTRHPVNSSTHEDPRSIYTHSIKDGLLASLTGVQFLWYNTFLLKVIIDNYIERVRA